MIIHIYIYIYIYIYIQIYIYIHTYIHMIIYAKKSSPNWALIFLWEAGCAGALLGCMTASSDVELMRWAAKALESLCAGDEGGVFSEAAAEVR